MRFAQIAQTGTRLIPALFLLFSGCSVNQWAIGKVSEAMTAEGNSVFTSDNDPEFVADALPFALKTYESLLQSRPEDDKLLLAAGKGFSMYAYAFIQQPAEMLSSRQVRKRAEELARAKKMYFRARDYLFRALDVRHPGFSDEIIGGATDSIPARTTTADTSLLYWTAAAWTGAYTTDKFDMKLAMTVKNAVAMVRRVLELNESYVPAHEYLISYYGSIPESGGGSKALAREHFAEAVRLSDGAKAAPYISLATSVAVANQDAKEFKKLLKNALAIDVDKYPEHRLANILSQRKAEWLLKNIDNYFLIEDEESKTQEQE